MPSIKQKRKVKIEWLLFSPKMCNREYDERLLFYYKIIIRFWDYLPIR